MLSHTVLNLQPFLYKLLSISIFFFLRRKDSLNTLVSIVFSFPQQKETHNMKFSVFTSFCIKWRIGQMWVRFLLTWDILWEFNTYQSQQDSCLFIAIIWHKLQRILARTEVLLLNQFVKIYCGCEKKKTKTKKKKNQQSVAKSKLIEMVP